MTSKKQSSKHPKKSIWYQVPEDVILIIVKPLNKPELGTLRLVDKRLRRITTPLLFRDLKLYLNTASIAKLVKIAHAKDLAPIVNGISFESYSPTECRFFVRKMTAALHAEDKDKDETKAEPCRHRALPSIAEGEAWINTVFHEKKWNDAGLFTSEPYMALGHAISHLQNLRSYTASNIPWSAEAEDTPFGQVMFDWTKDLPTNIESLHFFLHGLWSFQQHRVQLRKLDLCLRNGYPQFGQSAYPLRDNHATANLRQLVDISTRLGTLPLTRVEIDIQAVPSQKPLVIKFLSKAKHLKTLFWSLEWEVGEPELLKLRFPRLVHLRLQDGIAYPDQLVPFLKRHESTLRDVELLGVEVDGYLSGWKEVMTTLSEVGLEAVHIHPGGPTGFNFIYEMDACPAWFKACQDWILHGEPRPTFSMSRFQDGHILAKTKTLEDDASSDGGDDDYFGFQMAADLFEELPFGFPLVLLGTGPFPPTPLPEDE